jgi:hypothetical protein
MSLCVLIRLICQLLENQHEMEQMKRTWEEKLKDAQKSYGVCSTLYAYNCMKNLTDNCVSQGSR